MTVLVNDNLDRDWNDIARPFVFVIVVAIALIVICGLIPKAHAEDYPYLSTRPKEEVCSNWARNAALGAIVAARGIDIEKIKFEKSGHDDADAFTSRAAHQGYDYMKNWLAQANHPALPAEEVIWEQIGNLAYNACLKDPNAPGVGDGSPKTEM